MCGRELVTDCTEELEYSKTHSASVGVQLDGFPRIPRLGSD